MVSGCEHVMMKSVGKPRSKGRSQSQKVGRIKYTLQRIQGIEKSIEEVKLTQRLILAGLKDMFRFDKPFIQRIVCVDEVDILILDYLFEAGSSGLLPRDLAAKLTQFKVRRHQVSRRILRMNKRLEKEIGERVVEHHGWHWALTSFAFDSWGESERIPEGSEKVE